MDIPAPGVGAVCGACPDGYTGGDTKCYGIPEILNLHHVIMFCEQILMNVPKIQLSVNSFVPTLMVAIPVPASVATS